jgi:eukaryotic-like serine/threonine-protein kinase
VETFGRYELLRKLATGGMGAVYLARQKGPVGFQKLLVVKRLLPHLSEDDEFLQMFFDEARIAALLNHPNIAQIYEMGDVDGQYYIAMEYVHGEPLGSLLPRASAHPGGFPLGLKCRIVTEAAAGLDAAHNARSPSGRKLSLIHRDVSPQNVLVGFNGGVKLIDFGVAKAQGKLSQTVVGTIKGKHAYMSPEQARGEPLDARSDVFGLGTVFYELLTGGRLFKRETEMATLKAVVGHKIVPPSEAVPGIPKSLDPIVFKALARKRDDRFNTAGELQLALEEFLQQEKLTGTSAHLAAFMREVYSDELEEERFAAEPTMIYFDPRLMARPGGAAKAQQAPASPPPAAQSKPQAKPAKPAEPSVSQSSTKAAASPEDSEVAQAPERTSRTKEGSGLSRPEARPVKTRENTGLSHPDARAMRGDEAPARGSGTGRYEGVLGEENSRSATAKHEAAGRAAAKSEAALGDENSRSSTSKHEAAGRAAAKSEAALGDENSRSSTSKNEAAGRTASKSEPALGDENSRSSTSKHEAAGRAAAKSEPTLGDENSRSSTSKHEAVRPDAGRASTGRHDVVRGDDASHAATGRHDAVRGDDTGRASTSRYGAVPSDTRSSVKAPRATEGASGKSAQDGGSRSAAKAVRASEDSVSTRAPSKSGRTTEGSVSSARRPPRGNGPDSGK